MGPRRTGVGVQVENDDFFACCPWDVKPKIDTRVVVNRLRYEHRYIMRFVEGALKSEPMSGCSPTWVAHAGALDISGYTVNRMQ